jgi:hypothetical protein
MKKLFGAINFVKRNWKPLNFQIFVLDQRAKCIPYFWFTTIQNKITQTKVQKLRRMNKLQKKASSLTSQRHTSFLTNILSNQNPHYHAFSHQKKNPIPIKLITQKP